MKRILAIVPDLLTEVRIEEAAKRMGAEVDSVSPEEAAELIGSTRPGLVIADLAAPGLDVPALAAAARDANAPVVAFYPHVNGALRDAAKGAGIENVYARSRFLGTLSRILRERLQE